MNEIGEHRGRAQLERLRKNVMLSNLQLAKDLTTDCSRHAVCGLLVTALPIPTNVRSLKAARDDSAHGATQSRGLPALAAEAKRVGILSQAWSIMRWVVVVARTWRARTANE